MSDEIRKPAHEVLVEIVKKRGDEIVSLREDMAEGASRKVAGGALTIGNVEYKKAELMAIGGFTDSLDALDQMIIPEDKLQWVIVELLTVESKYPHGKLSSVLESLGERQN